MATTVTMPVETNSLAGAQDFLRKILEDSEISAVLVPKHLPLQGAIMPSLITDTEELGRADPFSPSYPLNSAKVVSRLTKGLSDSTIAAVLRPCEVRAFVELAKLNQGTLDGVVIIDTDCWGAFENRTYQEYIKSCVEQGIEDPTLHYLSQLNNEKDAIQVNGKEFPLSRACQACEHPYSKTTDLHINILGQDLQSGFTISSHSARGEGILNRMGLKEAGNEAAHDESLQQLIARRIEHRDVMFQETTDKTDSMEKLTGYLSNCVNCYNCRVACPVCYCKECVFLTDVFDHKPWQYLGWANQRGSLKMPTDTVFFHMTRLTHMSLSCIGCGQCSNACPNDIPVMELFRTIASKTQEAFDYVPGVSLSDKPPLSVFKEKEFSEVTGGVE